ncbi:hypothetical protein [Nitrosomonas sp. Nm34]|uniref:hypothetical protein n=1 Tax=Nitrosomonas sp. Nm34 TaxID=1881055 RepID=UPI0020C8E29E|nr:hypothetical protein [Nitrosomonas sp. Nm34]
MGATLIRRSTLADANAQRAPGLFREIMFWLIHKLQGNLPSANEIVRLTDSTTLDLNLHHYAWAKFRSTKAGIKLHTVYDLHACIPTSLRWVRPVRMKANTVFEVISSQHVDG